MRITEVRAHCGSEIDLSHVGGVTETKKLAGWAEALAALAPLPAGVMPRLRREDGAVTDW